MPQPPVGSARIVFRRAGEQSWTSLAASLAIHAAAAAAIIVYASSSGDNGRPTESTVAVAFWAEAPEAIVEAPTPVSEPQSQPQPAPGPLAPAKVTEIAPSPIQPPAQPKHRRVAPPKQPAPVATAPAEPMPAATEAQATASNSESTEASTASTPQAAAPAQIASASPAATSPPPVLQREGRDGVIVVDSPRYRRPPTPPVYPPRAIDLGQEGIAVIRALVSPDGETRQVVVWQSSGIPLLDQAALRAVRGWAFEAARIDNRAVEAWVEIPVRFFLRS